MAHENRIHRATIVRNLVLVVGFGGMAVAGCGFNAARDGVSPQASVSAIDVPALKEAALSNLAEGAQRIVSAGGGCVAELTIDPTLQRVVSDVLSRHADTNDAGIGWAVLISAHDGAVLALADCGGAADAPRPFALTRMFTPGHLISTLTVAAALDAGIATPDSELFTDASEAFYYQYKLPGDGGHIWESTLTVSNALAYSSNVVLAKLGILVGDIACAKGVLKPSHKNALRDLCVPLGLPPNYFVIFYRRRSATFREVEDDESRRDGGSRKGRKSSQRQKKSEQGARSEQRRQPPPPPKTALQEAYELLGCRSSDPNDVLRRAYREAAKRHHPDMLRARGYSDRQVSEACEMMSRINAAWEVICDERKL